MGQVRPPKNIVTTTIVFRLRPDDVLDSSRFFGPTRQYRKTGPSKRLSVIGSVLANLSHQVSHEATVVRHSVGTTGIAEYCEVDRAHDTLDAPKPSGL